MKVGTGIGVGLVLALALLAGAAQATTPQRARLAQPERARQTIDQASDRVAELRRQPPAADPKDRAHADEMIRSAARHLAIAQAQIDRGDPHLLRHAQQEAERALARLAKAEKLQAGVK